MVVLEGLQMTARVIMLVTVRILRIFFTLSHSLSEQAAVQCILVAYSRHLRQLRPHKF